MRGQGLGARALEPLGEVGDAALPVAQIGGLQGLVQPDRERLEVSTGQPADNDCLDRGRLPYCGSDEAMKESRGCCIPDSRTCRYDTDCQLYLQFFWCLSGVSI